MRITKTHTINPDDYLSRELASVIGTPHVVTVRDHRSIYLSPAPGDLPEDMVVILFVRKDGTVSALWDEMGYGLFWHHDDLPTSDRGREVLDRDVREAIVRIAHDVMPEDSDGRPGPDPYADPLFSEDHLLDDPLFAAVREGEVVEVP